MCARIQLQLAKSRSRVAQANISDAENTPRERRLQIRTQSISCSRRGARYDKKQFFAGSLSKEHLHCRVNSQDLALSFCCWDPAFTSPELSAARCHSKRRKSKNASMWHDIKLCANSLFTSVNKV